MWTQGQQFLWHNMWYAFNLWLLKIFQRERWQEENFYRFYKDQTRDSDQNLNYVLYDLRDSGYRAVNSETDKVIIKW